MHTVGGATSGRGRSSHLVQAVTLLLVMLGFSLLLAPAPALAENNAGEFSNRVVLTDDQGAYPLGLQLAILEDPSSELTFDEVSSSYYADQFEPSTEAVPSYGFSPSAYWARVEIDHQAGARGLWFLELDYSPMRRIDVYEVDAAGAVRRQEGGTALPFSERPMEHRTHLFELDLRPGETHTLYVRIWGESSKTLPLILWRADNFVAANTSQLYALGAYFGVIAGLFLYNLFIFATVRERAYLYYVLFLLTFGIYVMSHHGLAQQFLWRDHTTWAMRALPFFIGANGLFAGLFTMSFLQAKSFPPWVQIALWVGVVWGISLLFLSLLAPYQVAILMATLYGLSFSCVWLSVGVYAVVKGNKPARYYLLAWILLLLGLFAHGLRVLGWAPTNFLTQYAFLWGSAAETVLFSIALAARMRTLREEKEAAQSAVVENMQRMDQVKDEFLANTSHELRTPINGMIGLAEAMLQSQQEPITAEQRQNLNMIVSSGRRLTALVNDILDFSKLRHEDLVLVRRAVDIKALADVVLMLLRPLAQDKDIILRSNIPPNLPPVDADETRLQQILHNLIGNAIKFTENGSIELTAYPQGEQLAISVRDTGVGIPAEHLGSIFESFNQGDGGIAREFGGTGLGLSITRQMVELHGGSISVTSAVGEGSVFTFTLPIFHEDRVAEQNTFVRAAEVEMQPDIPVGVPVEPLTQNALPKGGLRGRLLVADDEPVNRQVLRSQLTGVGYEVVEAVDGQQALDLFERDGAFDLVLLDVMMPKLSGYAVCRELRVRWSPEELPVIFLTARTQSDDVVAALRCGANDYLSKPFSRDELQARVALHLDLSRRYRDLALRNQELETLTRENRSLEEISTTDQLTGLKNRRFFDIRYDEELKRACRTQQALSVLILDIDHFKAFNDTYGHLAGDDCLREVARTLQESITRPSDTVCRYGGEEFVALLANTTKEGTRAVAERIRRNVEALEFQVDGAIRKVTISIGAAVSIPAFGEQHDLLIQQADAALYKAKDNGRNRLEMAE